MNGKEITVKRQHLCDLKDCEEEPCDAHTDLGMCAWSEQTCCGDPMSLRDYSTDGDGLIFICEECNHEIGLFEIMVEAIDRGDGETWKMLARPRDYTRLGQ